MDLLVFLFRLFLVGIERLLEIELDFYFIAEEENS